LKTLPENVKKYMVSIGYLYPIAGYEYPPSYLDIDSDTDIDSDIDSDIEEGAEAPDLPEEKPVRKPDNRESPVEADRLAKTLLELHQAIDAGYAVTDGRLKAWAADIDKLNRIDGRSWEQIESVMRWAKADSFWQSNVIAGKTLRSQFTKLLIQMQNRPKQPEKPPERKIVAYVVPDYMKDLERRIDSER